MVLKKRNEIAASHHGEFLSGGERTVISVYSMREGRMVYLKCVKVRSVLHLESNDLLSHCGILGRETAHFILRRNFSLF